MSVKTDYLSATRLKLGYAWDRTMIYAAGGLETGLFDVSSTYVSRGAGPRLCSASPTPTSSTTRLQCRRRASNMR